MQSLESFLSSFVPKAAAKSKQMNLAAWILETTGSKDAAHLKAELDLELRTLYSHQDHYQQLLSLNTTSLSPLLQRQCNILLRTFKPNLIRRDLLEEITQKEADLLYIYANFRPKLQGKVISDNEIRSILKQETNLSLRKQAWGSSKEIGSRLAPCLLQLVHLRNQAARSLGYRDYFHMQLDLQEVEESWLFTLLDKLKSASDSAYQKVIDEVEDSQCRRFQVSKEDLGPWAWSDPFGQEDPIDTQELDSLVSSLDFCLASTSFYDAMGLDVRAILQRSDLFERPGKNQHAFCINIDRKGDIRTLNNLQPTLKWLETLLHELGHAVYEEGFDPALPWLLREPPHMITTEAMALLAGRQAYLEPSLSFMLGQSSPLFPKATQSLKRRQLIFCRWVLVMTDFESKLYQNPEQDLNALWWDKVYTYQKIQPPKGRNDAHDWAAKYHIGLAPVYYYSYLLGELFASSIEKMLQRETGSGFIGTKQAGALLQQRLFAPGSSLHFLDLIQTVTNQPFTEEDWIKDFS